MRSQISTTIEQSQRLIACGVNPDSADMYLEKARVPPIDFHLHTIAEGIDHAHWFAHRGNRDIIPAWSLSALLALLPSEIKEDNGYFDEISKYGLMIYPYMQGWQIDYQYCENDECHCLKCIHDAELIEACVKAIEWLTSNGYTLNKD